ncbi:MAG: 4-hydroxy-3-methylbut-2-enyl diphosphate reductase [Candidatus Oxydemutatoraceae bacterium WSBS_2016_MAG_OTU14]
MNMKIVLAAPRGFCAGVVRAIEIVEHAAEKDKEVYVRHEVVHNKHVVDELCKKGVKFVKETDNVPKDAMLIFSAHGVSPEIPRQAKAAGFKTLDATCPLVTKVHLEVQRHKKNNFEVILIGHAGHPEVLGTMGQYTDGEDIPADPSYQIYLVESKKDAEKIMVHYPDRLAVVTQTTLSVDDTKDILEVLKKRFPNIILSRKEDICYATQNRQNAVKQLTEICDLVLIVGSPNSSNSNRLCEVATCRGIEAKLIENAEAINPAWLDNKQCVGISAGASAPEMLVQGVIDWFRARGVTEVEEIDGIQENISFSLPHEIRKEKAQNKI